MSTPTKVAVVVGSLRKDSFSKKIAKALTELAPASLSFDFVDIGDLPLFNQDLEGAPPAQWTAFRDKVAKTAAVLFVTPEYNRSVPGVLKNAIDVGSRPYGHSVWNAKPAAVFSVSPGGFGAFGANHHLRQSLMFLNMPVLQQPEAYLSHVSNVLNDAGAVTSEDTKKFLAGFMTAFAAWIAQQQK